MGVSKNRGVYHYFHHPFWGTPFFGNIHVCVLDNVILQYSCFRGIFIQHEISIPRDDALRVGFDGRLQNLKKTCQNTSAIHGIFEQLSTGFWSNFVSKNPQFEA